jgi:hypothetical protein
MKKQKFLIPIIVIVLLVVIIGVIIFYVKEESRKEEPRTVLLEVRWHGNVDKLLIIYSNGNFFINGKEVSDLDKNDIKLLKNTFGEQSVEGHFSFDIRNTDDIGGSYDIRYFAKEPIRKLDGSIYYYSLSGGLENASKSGDWEELNKYIQLINSLRNN